MLCGACCQVFRQFFNPDLRPESDYVKEQFKVWDEDGSGYIEKDEIMLVLKGLDPDFANRDLDRLFSTVDKNGDGVIQIEEFVDWLMHDDPLTVGLGHRPDDSFEAWIANLMQECGEAQKIASLGISEIHIRDDGLFFKVRAGEIRFETVALRSPELQLKMVEPDEFVMRVEANERGFIVRFNTGREEVMPAEGPAFGPFAAPEGFHIVGLRPKPADESLPERIVGVDFAPLAKAASYDPNAALKFCTEREYLSPLRRLLAKHAGDVVCIDGFGIGSATAMMLAAQNNAVGAIRLLLSSLANPDVKDADGWDALTFAAKFGMKAAVAALVEHEQKKRIHAPSAVDPHAAAIQQAVRNQHNSAARMLLRAGLGSSEVGSMAVEDSVGGVGEDSCTLAVPVISPEGGAHSGPVTVRIVWAPPGADQEEAVAASMRQTQHAASIQAALNRTSQGLRIFYTTDGRDPFVVGKRYRGPVTVSAPYTNVRCVVVKGRERSAIVSKSFTVCQQVLPNEIVSGAVSVRVFEDAIVSVQEALSMSTGVPPGKLHAWCLEEEGRARGGSQWLWVNVKDKKPDWRLNVQCAGRPWVVSVAKKKKKFLKDFIRDVGKAVGEKPSDVSFTDISKELMADEFHVDFSMSGEAAEELERQLADGDGWLLSAAPLREIFEDGDIVMTKSLGDHLSEKICAEEFQKALGRGSGVQEVVGFGKTDSGVLGVLVAADKADRLLRNIAPSVNKACRGFDLEVSRVKRGAETLDIGYAIDICNNAHENPDGLGRIDPGSVVRHLNGRGFTDAFNSELEARGLPAEISVKTRAASRQLGQVELVLRWGEVVGHPRQDFLDGVCFVYCEESLAHIIDFRCHSRAGSIHDGPATPAAERQSLSIARAVHHSDGWLEAAEDDCHRLIVDLQALPLEVTDLYFVMMASEHDAMVQFPEPAIQIHDCGTRRLLSEYCCQDTAGADAVVMGRLSRPDGGTWLFHAVGAPTEGNVNNYGTIRQVLAQVQKGYSHWERRETLVKLRVMLRKGYIDEGPTGNLAQMLWAVLRLPTPVFQLLVMLL